MNSCSLEQNPFDDFVILSVTHRSADSMEALSSLVIKQSDREELLRDLKQTLDAEELVYISTCNRVSFMLVSHRPPEVLLKVLRHWFIAAIGNNGVPAPEHWNKLSGRKAIDQLLMVTSSLDSMVVGERQILGQVKQAFRECSEWGLAGKTLRFVFEQAFKIAKKVYTATDITHGKLSVVSLVEEKLDRYCAGGKPMKAALVGAGKMTEKIAEFLQNRKNVEMVFVNRTVERGAELAGRFGGSARSLDSFLAVPGAHDILATATAAPHAIFTPGFIHECRGDGELLVIDLAIPADVDPDAAKLPNVTLYNMDALRQWSESGREERRRNMQQAEEIIRDGAEGLVDRWKILAVNPAIGELTQRYSRESLDSLNRLLDSDLAHLGKDDKSVLTKWAVRLAKQWAVLQAAGVRETARKCCTKAVATYLESMGFGVEQHESRQQTH